MLPGCSGRKPRFTRPCVLGTLALRALGGLSRIGQRARLQRVFVLEQRARELQTEVRRRFATAGVRAFIQKPYKSSALVETVRACFEED